MVHQHDDAEAVVVSEGEEPASAASLTEDEFAQLFDGDEPETDSVDEEAGEEPDDIDEEVDDDGEEEAQSQLDPPSSLTAEEKALWSDLPHEAQAIMASVEARRTADVERGLSKAKAAQQETERLAAEHVASVKQMALEQVYSVVVGQAPQMPDPNLANINPQAYVEQFAQYQAGQVQHEQLMVAIQHEQQQLQAQSAQQEREAFIQDALANESSLPEIRDDAKFQALVESLVPIAKELGYDDKRIAMAWPSDIAAMKKAADWRSKAQKWEALQGKRMERVRGGKFKSSKPNANGGVKSGQRAKANQQFRQNPHDMNAAAAVFADLI